MLVGYNTNISYKGKTYHIQTEDSGQSNPMIVTLLFSKGAILASRRTNYAHITGDPDYMEKVAKIMKAQHKGMIKELLAGRHTGESGEVEAEKEVGEVQTDVKEAEPPVETADQPVEKIEIKTRVTKSLDDILLNYIMKRADK
jgi:hypothetical protein